MYLLRNRFLLHYTSGSFGFSKRRFSVRWCGARRVTRQHELERGGEATIGREDERSFHRVGEFTDVPGPGLRHQQLDRRTVQPGPCQAMTFRCLPQEMVGKKGDVSSPLAQRRQAHRQNR